jgi:type IV pilus assembly protein PilC
LLRSEIRLQSTLRTVLAYPVLLASVSSLVLAGLVLFVLPQFAEIFEQYDVPLPVLTQILLGISYELRVRFWLWGAVLIAGVVGLVVLRFSGAGKRCWDGLMLNVILVRDVTRALLIGRTCRMLGIMISSGVPLLETLKLARSSVRNSLYQDLLLKLEHDVTNGRGLGDGLLNARFVPSSAAEMVATAERTGTIGMVTEMIGQHYEEEGEAKLRELVTIMEPMIIVGMGIIVAIVVLSVMLPMFDLATLAQQQ